MKKRHNGEASDAEIVITANQRRAQLPHREAHGRFSSSRPPES